MGPAQSSKDKCISRAQRPRQISLPIVILFGLPLSRHSNHGTCPTHVFWKIGGDDFSLSYFLTGDR